MRKLLSGFAILITLIIAFIAYMFCHEPSSDELVGRSVALEFGTKHEIHISKLSSQFIASDTSFSNSNKFTNSLYFFFISFKGIP